jgi:coproporphyrinogen III oxidase-like Fe-S oxidoreductase
MFTYLKNLSENKLNASQEHLSFTEKYHEKIMIGLRLSKGIAHTDMQNFLDDKIAKHFNATLNKHQIEIPFPQMDLHIKKSVPSKSTGLED